MSRFRTVLLSASLGLGALMPATSNATGTDSVVHPNSACQWDIDFTFKHPDIEGALYSRTGWQHQVPDTVHDAVCGIDRFNITNTTGLRDLDVRLRNDQVEPVRVTCEALSLRPDGTIVKSLVKEATFVGPYRMDFNGELNQSVAYGAYAVSCALPTHVNIVNILQREY